MTPEEKKLDKYYIKRFNWTLIEVNCLSEKQNNCCAICRRPPGKIRLSLDHDHEYDRTKVTVEKVLNGYIASAHVYGVPFVAGAATRPLVREFLRRELRRASVRGLLCFLCNGGIQKFEDSKAPLAPAERFDRAAKYFRDFRSLSEQAQRENPPLQIT